MFGKKLNKILIPVQIAWAIILAMVIVGCTQPAGSGGSSGSSSNQGTHHWPGDPGVNPQALNNLTVNVVDETGAPIVGGFRWLLELDTTVDSVPGDVNSTSMGVNISGSYAPVMANGSTRDLRQ